MAPGDRQPQGTAIDGSMPMEHVAIDMLTKDRLCAEGRIESTRDDTSRRGRSDRWIDHRCECGGSLPENDSRIESKPSRA